jgi:hypothetical protein
MTEAEWLAATDPTPMLEFARGTLSDRKLRLFVVSLSQLFWNDLNIEEIRSAILTNEKYADGMATEDELCKARSTAHGTAHNVRWYWQNEPGGYEVPERRKYLTDRLGQLTEQLCRRFFFAVFMTNRPERLRREPMPMLATDPVLYKESVNLLRCVLGNPFRPVTIDPSWLTSTVLALAEGIYQDRAFDRLPILADSLMDAGCENEDILNHSRSDGVHVRGCWVVDLLTGRS